MKRMIFVCCGLLLWHYFSVVSCVNVETESENVTPKPQKLPVDYNGYFNFGPSTSDEFHLYHHGKHPFTPYPFSSSEEEREMEREKVKSAGNETLMYLGCFDVWKNHNVALRSMYFKGMTQLICYDHCLKQVR